MRDLLIAALVGTPFLVGATVAAASGEDPDRVPGVEVLRFEDDRIVESSGLVVEGGHAVTMNDSGDSARVFTVDLTTGRTVGVTQWAGAAYDLEALAPAGPAHVWAGDLGDNGRLREEVWVTRVPVGRGELAVPGERYSLTMPDGPSDAEALLAHPVTGRLYVVTKSALGGRILEAPARLDPAGANQLRQIGQAPGLVTDAAFFPDGKHLVVRNYQRAWVYTFPGLQQVGAFYLPRQSQGEGIAVAADGALYISSEGSHAALLRVTIPTDVARVLAGAPPLTTPSSSGTPAPEPAGRNDASRGGGTSPWTWLLGGATAVAAVLLLVRSLRPR